MYIRHKGSQKKIIRKILEKSPVKSCYFKNYDYLCSVNKQ